MDLIALEPDPQKVENGGLVNGLGGSVHCTQYVGSRFWIDFCCDSDVCLLEKLTAQEPSSQTAAFHPAIV